MKALPMTMEDKCAFVDLISQNSGNGGSQEDEYFYIKFLVTFPDDDSLTDVLKCADEIIFEVDNKTVKTPSALFNTLNPYFTKTLIALKCKRIQILPDYIINSLNNHVEVVKENAFEKFKSLIVEVGQEVMAIISKEEYESIPLSPYEKEQ